jgi:hypothetical protein
LVEDPAIIAECRSEIRSKGGLFVCHRCTKVDSCVVAILVVSEDPDKCYAICRQCLCDLPEGMDT